MKKILYLINNLNRGGAERAFTNQINYFCEHGSAEHVYLGTLYSSKEENYFSELKLPGNRIVNFRVKGLFDPRGLLRIRKYIKMKDIGIVYSTLEFANIYARLLKTITPNIKIYLRESGTGKKSDNRKLADFKYHKFKIIDLLLNWLVSKIIVLSHEMKELAQRYQKVYSNKFKVISNGVVIKDTEKEIKENISKKLKIPKFIILAVGSMSVKERAFEYIIEAVKIIKEKHSKLDLELRFAGKGKFEKFYRALADDWGLRENVIFRGHLSTAELEREYRSANAFIMSSTAEGCPNVILEAMSFGLPIISTDVGAIPELVKEGFNGYLVKPQDAKSMADKIIALVSDNDNRREFSLNSYLRAKEKYSLDIKMLKLIKLINEK